MCDYSLQNVKSQPAQVADKLVTRNFGTGTVGFTPQQSTDDRVAVCLLPGTEIAFDKPITIGGYSSLYALDWQQTEQTVEHRTARFRQINKDVPHTHHDALELPDGQIVVLSHLIVGQCATVLQLPATPRNEVEAEEQRRVEYAG